jgi:hypothetical protein
VEWIDDAGKAVGFTVKSETRRKTHGKLFQIDSLWFKDRQLVAFVEAETRWEMNHIIGHLTCCIDYALQEAVHPFFLLVFLENDADHCSRLHHTWHWLTSLLPPRLQIRCLPLLTRKNDPRDGLHVATITKHEFAHAIQRLLRPAET